MRTRPYRSFIEASYKSADSLRWGRGRRCVLSSVQVSGRRSGFRDIPNQEKRCCPQGSHQGNREALIEGSFTVLSLICPVSVLPAGFSTTKCTYIFNERESVTRGCRPLCVAIR